MIYIRFPVGSLDIGLHLLHTRFDPFFMSITKYIGALRSIQESEVYGMCRPGVGRLHLLCRMKKVTYIVTESGCHHVTSHKPTSGGRYAKVTVGSKTTALHRYIYQEAFGAIPAGHVIRHKCDNPLCVNIDHLLLGTQADNMRDKVNRGRQKRGNQIINAKLTDEEVVNIHEWHKRGFTKSFIAEIYEVHPSIISSIIKGLSWSHVQPKPTNHGNS